MQLKPILALLAAGTLAAAPAAFAAGDKGAAYGGSGGSTMQQGSLGEHSEAIKKVQQSLNDEGHSAGPVDGIMGDQTRSALSKFQEEKGLQASGTIDRETVDALGLDPEASEFSAFIESQEGVSDDSGVAPSDSMQDGGMRDDGVRDGGMMQPSPGAEGGMSSPEAQ